MKRIITAIIIAACIAGLAVAARVTAGAAGGVAARILELEERQDTAHEAAELLRELGYADDSTEIQGLSQMWWEAQGDIDVLSKLRYVGEYRITGYTIDTCGKTPSHPYYGVTASGVYATPFETLATSSREFGFGTQLYIDGLDIPGGDMLLTVEDRGVGIGVIDVCCETLEQCYAITGRYPVYVLEE